MAPPTFAMSAFLQASTTLRSVGQDASSLEEVAAEIVGHLREQFVNKVTGRSALPLVRLYATRRSDELEPEVQDFARAVAPEAFSDRNVVCLTLLGTAGDEPSWNDRRASLGHKAIPLPSVEALRRSPMIAQLIAQLGIDAQHVIEPDPDLFRAMEERTYDVFYVPDARDSPYVPDQNNFGSPAASVGPLGLLWAQAGGSEATGGAGAGVHGRPGSGGQ